MTHKSVEGVTQKLSSTYLESKTSISFPKPGIFDLHRAAALRFRSSNHLTERDIKWTEYMIGKLGAHTPKVSADPTFKENNSLNSTKQTKHPMASSVDDTASILHDKKKRRTNLLSASDGWMKFNMCSTTPSTKSSCYRSPSTRSTTVSLRKEQQRSLGDIYDYQLDRLAMKPCDRDRHFPRSLSCGEDDERSEDVFFSPIRYDLSTNQDKEQSEDEDESTIKHDTDNQLLTPDEINFDDVCQENLSCKEAYDNEDTMDKASDDIVNDEENPFAAFARDYLKV